MGTQEQKAKSQKGQEVIMPEDRLYDVQTVSRKLSISKSTVYRLFETGQLPFRRMGRKYGYRVSKQDLDRFIAEREVTIDI